MKSLATFTSSSAEVRLLWMLETLEDLKHAIIAELREVQDSKSTLTAKVVEASSFHNLFLPTLLPAEFSHGQG
jgi:hypothetical protein